MRKFIKFLIGLGIILVLAGGAIVGYAAYKGKFGPVSYEEKEYSTELEFKNLKINLETTDVKFVKSEDDKCTISYVEEKGYTHTFDVKNDTLEVYETCNLKWYERLFTWEFKDKTLKIALPNNVYEDISLTLATGDIDINGFDFKNVLIKGSTGDVYLTSVSVIENISLTLSTGKTEFSNVTANSCVINDSTGDVKLNNTKIVDSLKIKSSTGDITFSRSDAKTIEVKTSTGDITGSILTPKTFHTKTSTGCVEVPKTTGDDCTLTTSTGDIYITISE